MFNFDVCILYIYRRGVPIYLPSTVLPFVYCFFKFVWVLFFIIFIDQAYLLIFPPLCCHLFTVSLSLCGCLFDLRFDYSRLYIALFIGFGKSYHTINKWNFFSLPQLVYLIIYRNQLVFISKAKHLQNENKTELATLASCWCTCRRTQTQAQKAHRIASRS